MKKEWMKKILVLMMASVMMGAAGSVFVHAADDNISIAASASEKLRENDFYYRVMDDGTVSIEKYDGSLSELTIPETIGGKPVTVISQGAFSTNTALTSVTFPNTVRVIGSAAFWGCTSLTTVTFPDSLKVIESSAFNRCESLAQINIPQGIERVGNHAFDNTAWYNDQPEGAVYLGSVLYHYRQTGDENVHVTIKDGTKMISDSAFAGCDHLTGVTIPASVESIGDFAFERCTGLTKVTIPDSVKEIGSFLFSQCDNLREVVLSKEITRLPSSLFQKCTSLTAVTLPDSITEIGTGAFKECKALKRLTIPANVEHIGYHAFKWCSALTDITFEGSPSVVDDDAFRYTGWYSQQPRGVVYVGTALYQYKDVWIAPENGHMDIRPGTTSITGHAFEGCSGLKTVSIPDSVVSIGTYAFSKCTALQDVTLPSRLEDLDGYVFSGCTYLKSVTLPQGLKKINAGVFRECKKLKSIVIPASVDMIGIDAFYRCTTLGDVTFNGLDIEFFNDCIFEDCSSELTFSGRKNSSAEAYAKKNNIPFRCLLTNVSYLGAAAIVKGESCDVHCVSAGGTAPCTSSVYYRKLGKTKWSAVKVDTTDEVVSITPQAAGAYEVRVAVKDAAGNVERKDMTLQVNKSLTNTSKLGQDSFTLGSKVKVRCSALGGAGDYTYAVYYKKSSSAKWSKVRDYAAYPVVMLTPKTATSYDVRVDVKDKDGHISSKTLKLNGGAEPAAASCRS